MGRGNEVIAGWLCWSNSPAERETRRIKSRIHSVAMGPGLVISQRSDYIAKQRFFDASLIVATDVKMVYLIASCMDEAMLWLKAINLLLDRSKSKLHPQEAEEELALSAAQVSRPGLTDARKATVRSPALLAGCSICAPSHVSRLLPPALGQSQQASWPWPSSTTLP